MDDDADGGPVKNPWWLWGGSRGFAYALAGLWLVLVAVAVGQFVSASGTGSRWVAAVQGGLGLFLAGVYLASARYDGPRRVSPPSTSRWGSGRPGERWR